MLTITDFKKKYPRQFKRLMEYYGKQNYIHDPTAAIHLYLRGDPPPKCELCNKPLTISKKFRQSKFSLRCGLHVNTHNILSKENVLAAETNQYKVVNLPNKLLTPTDNIEVECKDHGVYKVKLGHFLKGMQCQKCYHNSRIGTLRGPHSDEAKQKISLKRAGKKVQLTAKVKEEKALKQKEAWVRRRNDKEKFEKYIETLSLKRKQYLEKNLRVLPKKEQTGLERKFEKFLIDNGIKYQTQYILGNKKFDFFLPDMLLLVEVDGEYWHRLAPSIANDIIKHKICINEQIQLVRISSDNYCPEIIFKDKETQNRHTKQILIERGIMDEF